MNPSGSARSGPIPVGDVNAQILAAYTGGLAAAAAATQPGQAQTSPSASGILPPYQTQMQPPIQQLSAGPAQYWQGAQPQNQLQLMPQVIVPGPGPLGTYPFGAQCYPQVQMAMAQLAAQNMQLQAAMSCAPQNVRVVPHNAQFAAPLAGQHTAQTGAQVQAQTGGARSAPVGSVADDETRLLGALKTFRARKISIRQAIEQLDGVNAHSASEWKDYFLDHLDKFHHLVGPRRRDSHSERRLPSLSRSPSLESLSDDGLRRDSERRQPATSAPRRPFVFIPREHVRPLASPENVSSRPGSARTSGDSHGRDGTRRDRHHDSASPASTLPTFGSTRRTRGEPVAEFHAGTLIPPTSSLIKPRAPLRDDAEDNSSSLFTDADHRFFIAFLRWKLARQPNMKKQELYAALAAETPYRSAEAWKRHWDNNPRMPDAIYIQASKQRVESRDDSLSYEESVIDISSVYASEDEVTSSVAKAAAPKRKRAAATARKRGRQKVTEDDLRAMAKYLYEKMETWHTLPGKLDRWKEFAQRPENAAKRSLAGWASIEKGRNLDALEFYYDEYRRAKERTVARPALPRRQGAIFSNPSTVVAVAIDPSASGSESTPTTDSSAQADIVQPVREEPASIPSRGGEFVARDEPAGTDKALRGQQPVDSAESSSRHSDGGLPARKRQKLDFNVKLPPHPRLIIEVLD
ncbi:hypothetical protein C8Q79DRAFT_943248 [Trametes meyenii]|nr:hypothetical protein C8Q79DRAFT_943248 [Trametes meyenii]